MDDDFEGESYNSRSYGKQERIKNYAAHNIVKHGNIRSEEVNIDVCTGKSVTGKQYFVTPTGDAMDAQTALMMNLLLGKKFYKNGAYHTNIKSGLQLFQESDGGDEIDVDNLINYFEKRVDDLEQKHKKFNQVFDLSYYTKKVNLLRSIAGSVVSEFDLNKDGIVTNTELKEITEDHKLYDKNSDKYVSFSEIAEVDCPDPPMKTPNNIVLNKKTLPNR